MTFLRQTRLIIRLSGLLFCHSVAMKITLSKDLGQDEKREMLKKQSFNPHCGQKMAKKDSQTSKENPIIQSPEIRGRITKPVTGMGKLEDKMMNWTKLD